MNRRSERELHWRGKDLKAHATNGRVRDIGYANLAYLASVRVCFSFKVQLGFGEETIACEVFQSFAYMSAIQP